jgi:hypothetical protein
MRWLSFWAGLLSIITAQAQCIDLRLLPQWKGVSFTPGQWLDGAQGEKIIIENLGVYVASFESGLPVFHLLQWTEDFVRDSCSVPVLDGRLLVQFGVDSVTRARGVMRGDLDPLLGYYWTWQSGYIHLKCEGVWVDHKGQSNRFTWHLGGSEANACVSKHNLKLPIDHSVVWDIWPIFEAGLPQHHQIMSPGPEAKKMFDKFILCMHGL